MSDSKLYTTGTPQELYTKGKPDRRVIYSITMPNSYSPGSVIKNPDDTFTARRGVVDDKDGFATEAEAVRWMLTSEQEESLAWAGTLAELVYQLDAE